MQNFIITLLICSATMSVLALFYMAITPFFAKSYSEKWRYYAWLIILIGLIIPFRPSWANTIFTVDVPMVDAGNYFVNTATQTLGDNVATFAADASITPVAAIFNITLWHGIGLLWLIGLAVFVAFKVIMHYRFVKTAKRWSEAVTDEQAYVFHELKMEMGIKGQIGLYINPCASSPMMIGLIKPQILLPTDELGEDELRFILKHELVHYKRKDLLYKSLVLVATAIHWFNPVVYLIARAVNTLCETSCDDEIVRNANEDTRQKYSETIIGVMKYRSTTKLSTAFSTNFYGGKRGMKNRISSIMDMSKKRAGAFILCGVLVLTLGTSAVVAANAQVPATGNVATFEANAYAQEPATNNIAVAESSTTIDTNVTAPQNRRSPIVIFAEYEEWGLTIEGLYPNSDGSFRANPIQNVFYQEQLIRGFSDFGHGVDMSISSFDQGGDIWIHVVRDVDGNIERLDTE